MNRMRDIIVHFLLKNHSLMQFDSIGGSIMIQFYLIQCRLKLNIVSSQKENKNWILFIPLSLQIKILMDRLGDQLISFLSSHHLSAWPFIIGIVKRNSLLITVGY